MLFNFSLAALENISPWGSGTDLHLSWFGLTDGCYWLRSGDVELFRYSEQLLEKAGRRDDYAGCGPYVDYQVVRLWDDVLEVLPDVLSPVPQVVAEKLAAPRLQAWRAAVEHWMLSKPIGLDEPLYEAATEWVRKRHLLSGHLKAGPHIWLWNDGTDIHLEWDNRELQIDGISVWNALIGSWQLPIEAFLEEVRAFDSAFMGAMQRRVDQIAGGWSRPGLRIDIDQLVLEQADRSTWLERSLGRAHQEQSCDWSTILNAIAIIDAETKP